MADFTADFTANFTVAICTYNGATRLPEVLEHLQRQVNTDEFTWEVLVVDNNSTDRTADVVPFFQEHCQTHWRQDVPLRYCFETQQGAGYARKRAIYEATGSLVGFLDDDNLPAETWVSAAYAFARSHPQAGAFGSQIHGIYEVEPPPNFHRIKPFLAITERGSEPLLYDPKSKLLPPSAGLVVRKQAWLECVPDRAILTGRTQGKMLTSEDLEVLSHIQQSPWEIWYNPDMELGHKIPHWRLERAYLLALIRGIGLSRYVTRTIGVSPTMKPVLTVAYMANDLRKVLLHLLKYGTAVKTDLAAACELELYLSSLASPFYLWKNGYLKEKQTEK